MSNLKTTINKNAYKFALFGIARSGKTCILSALALPRVSNPKGFTCTWIEHVPGHEISTNSAEIINAEDPFVVGAKWLKESKELLKKGDIPQANPNHNIMRFLFEFGSKENGSISVELIDYSGELLVASGADLAIKLKQIMWNCDGLLVLAEVPKSGSESVTIDALDDLSKAFATLAKERDSGPKQEWPIALLFNKWDRRLNNESITSIGQEAIDSFLLESPEPPHKSLVDKITNFIGNENIRCFPVSAFGSHNINQEGKEVPKTNGQMLKTINLEDGFIWLVERSDTLKVKMLLEASEKTSWWMTQQLIFGARPDFNVAQSSAIKNWFCGISASKGIDAAWNISHKLPDKSEIKEKTNKILRLFRLKALAQLASFLLMIILSAEFLEIGYDGVIYREIRARRENPATDGEILKKDEKWLANYFASPNYRHFLSRIWVLTKNQANMKANEWASNRQKKLQEIVIETEKKGDPGTIKIAEENLAKDFPEHPIAPKVAADKEKAKKEERCKENENYLVGLETKIGLTPTNIGSEKKFEEFVVDISNLKYPPDITEADKKKQEELKKQIIEKLSSIATLRRNKNENYLVDLETKIGLTPTNIGSEKKFSEFVVEISKLPYDEDTTTDHKMKQKELRDLVTSKLTLITILIEKEKLEKFIQEYNTLINNGNIVDAAKHLVSSGELGSSSKSSIETLKENFKSKAPDIIIKNVTSVLNNQRYDDARNKLNIIQDLNLNTLLTDEQIKSLKMIYGEINISEDKHLYAQLVTHKNISTIENYLTKAPLKTMKKEAQEYKSYLGKLMGEIEVSIDCKRIDWGTKFYSWRYYYYNNVEVFVNGEKIISKNKIDSVPNTSSSVGEATTKISLDKNIEITVKIITLYGSFEFWQGKMDGGKGSWSGTAFELQSSKTIDLVPDDNAFRNKATIILNGIPIEPSLPEWKQN